MQSEQYGITLFLEPPTSEGAIDNYLSQIDALAKELRRRGVMIEIFGQEYIDAMIARHQREKSFGLLKHLSTAAFKRGEVLSLTDEELKEFDIDKDLYNEFMADLEAKICER